MPLDIVLAKPIYADHEICDLEIIWANQMILSRGDFNPVGLNLRQVFPELHAGDWFDFLREQKLSKTSNQSPRKVSVYGPSGIPYELTTLWVGEFVYAHVSDIEVKQALDLDIPFALQLIFKAVSAAPMAVKYQSRKTIARLATASFLDRANLTQEQFEATDLADYVDIRDLEKYQIWSHGQQRDAIEIRITRPGRESQWVSIAHSVVGNLINHTDGSMDWYLDITDSEKSKELIQDLADSKAETIELIGKALNEGQDGIAIWTRVAGDSECEYVLDFINDVGAKPAGKRREVLIGQNLSTVLPNESQRLAALFEKTLRTEQKQVDIVEIDGEAGWIGTYENTVIPLGENQVVAYFRDLSNERREKKRLEWIANHDHLTGLINRRGLELALEERFSSMSSPEDGFAFAFLDLDGFKKINDEMGHERGDVVLKEFGQQLVEVVSRVGGTVCRIAGDEFGLILNWLGSEQDCSDFLSSLREQVQTNFKTNLKIDLRFCAGLVRVNQPNASVSEVLRVADRAMYAAKHAGKNQFNVSSIQL